MYYADFLTDNHIWLANMKSTNKRKLIREISRRANQARNCGEHCEWWVVNDNNECVAAGVTWSNGKRERFDGNRFILKTYDNQNFISYGK